MADKKRTRSKLSDLLPNMGPGLFVTLEAKASATRALSAITEQWSLQVQGRDVDAARRLFASELTEIANDYWADRAYDRRMTHADMKNQIKPLGVCGPIRISAASVIEPRCAKGSVDRISRCSGAYSLMKS